MSYWDHLFLTGEFRAREDLLSGLTLEPVTLRPTGASHSIYQELWHSATDQRCVVDRDKELDALLRGGTRYPSAAMVVPDGEWEAVGRDAHAVIDEAKAAGVDVFGGGNDDDVPPVLVSAHGAANAAQQFFHPASQSTVCKFYGWC